MSKFINMPCRFSLKQKRRFRGSKAMGVKLPKWESQYERLYTDTKDCLKKLSRIYKIGVIAN